MQPPTDEELMLRVRVGDERALETLLHRYESPVFNFARRMLGNASEAEDIFQETFIRVYRNRHQFDATALFRPWLYRIAANLCYDKLRWWMRRPTVSLDAGGGEINMFDRVASPAASPADAARTAELQRAIDRAIAALPIRHRTVFLMARYDRMNYAEIAEALAIPVGTVKSRMNKAVTLLMHDLREFNP